MRLGQDASVDGFGHLHAGVNQASADPGKVDVALVEQRRRVGVTGVVQPNVGRRLARLRALLNRCRTSVGSRNEPTGKNEVVVLMVRAVGQHPLNLPLPVLLQRLDE